MTVDVEPETAERPEYKAWLIRNPRLMLLYSFFGLVLLSWARDFLEVFGLLNRASHHELDSRILAAISAPLFYSTLAIFFMKWLRMRESLIKAFAVIIFFLVMFVSVYTDWNLLTVSY